MLYEQPNMELVELEPRDVITVSDGGNGTGDGSSITPPSNWS